MKYFQFVFLTGIFICHTFTTFSQSKQIILEPNESGIHVNDLNKSSEIIRSRLEILNIDPLSIDVRGEDGKLSLVVDQGVLVDNEKMVLTNIGELSIRETAMISDLSQALSTNDPILDYLSTLQKGGVFIQVEKKDVSVVNKHLERLKKMREFSEVDFVWGIADQRGNRDLFCLVKYPKIQMDRGDISEMEFNTLAGGEESTSIVFTGSGKAKWAEMTKANQDRVLAVVLDGQVLMSPRVTEVITSGECQITGLWGNQSEMVLYAILQTPKLPVSFQIK